MTLMYEFDLDILKTYVHANNEVLHQGFQKLEPKWDTDRPTDGTEHITTLHSQLMISSGSAMAERDSMTQVGIYKGVGHFEAKF